jgi:hypothetical protein
MFFSARVCRPADGIIILNGVIYDQSTEPSISLPFQEVVPRPRCCRRQASLQVRAGLADGRIQTNHVLFSIFFLIICANADSVSG